MRKYKQHLLGKCFLEINYDDEIYINANKGVWYGLIPYSV